MDQKGFDSIIKQNIINAIGTDIFGPDGYSKQYPCHYNNTAFEGFINQMRTEYRKHFDKYENCKGSELKPIDSKPPKMSSVASSSRFCYLALRNGAKALGTDAEVEFEYSCNRISGIIGGTPPQMDAYIAADNIFVEVKCHEIFTDHKIILSNQYKKLLYGDDSDFGFSAFAENNGREFLVPSDEFGVDFGIKKDHTRFDIKQFICHLLGIKSTKKNGENATLVYLFFKPKASSEEQNAEIEAVFDELKAEIQIVFNSKPIQRFITKNNIKLRAVAEYAEVMSPLTNLNIIELYH